jgi:Zn-dependent protease with chaperone function
MSYENPRVPHEVNVSRESVMVEFLRLVAGIGLCVAIAAGVLWACGGWLARRIPFTTEVQMVGDRVIGIDLFGAKSSDDRAKADEVERYLRERVAALGTRMDLPPGMIVQIHLVDSDTANAFATLGGHVVVTRGLYQRMPSENALAFVLAHEIAHLRARDPISAIGGSASVVLLLAVVGGEVSGLLPHVAQLVTLGYSRAAETRADGLAIAALQATYGHARDADAAMRALAESRRDAAIGAPPTLLSTHPADADRIARLRSAAETSPEHVAITPLRVTWSANGQLSAD